MDHSGWAIAFAIAFRDLLNDRAAEFSELLEWAHGLEQTHGGHSPAGVAAEMWEQVEIEMQALMADRSVRT